MKGYVLTLDVTLAFSVFSILFLIMLILLTHQTTSGDEQQYRISNDIALIIDNNCTSLDYGNIREVIEKTPWNVCASIEIYNSTDNIIYSTVKTNCTTSDHTTVSYYTCSDGTYGRVKTWFR
ncbi:hypothetical protein J7J90_03670 [Candidatus Micrarchaeota archaeon]|nr:hypothetical protein [Candidatus Micrarchaeota archaeon]